TSSRPPTGSSTWDPRAAPAAGAWWPRARRSRSQPIPRAIPAAISRARSRATARPNAWRGAPPPSGTTPARGSRPRPLSGHRAALPCAPDARRPHAGHATCARQRMPRPDAASIGRRVHVRRRPHAGAAGLSEERVGPVTDPAGSRDAITGASDPAGVPRGGGARGLRWHAVRSGRGRRGIAPRPRPSRRDGRRHPGRLGRRPPARLLVLACDASPRVRASHRVRWRPGRDAPRGPRPARVRPAPDAGAARGARAVDDPDRWRAVLVADRLRRGRRRAHEERQRARAPARGGSRAAPRERGGDPFALGPGDRGEDGPDTGSHQPPCGQARAGRRLPRPVRRVLRDRACAHGARRAGTRAGRLPGLAARATQARPVAGASRGTRRRAAVPRDRLRRVPHDPWHGRRRQPGPRPHALRQSHHRRGGPLSDEHRDHRGLGRRRAGAQTGQPHALFRTGARRGRPARDRRLPGEPRMTRPTVEPGLRSEPARDEGASQLQQAWAVPRGIRYWTEVNNTQIVVWYAATAFFFFLFAGVLALLMRTQLAVPGNELLEPGTYNQF